MRMMVAARSLLLAAVVLAAALPSVASSETRCWAMRRSVWNADSGVPTMATDVVDLAGLRAVGEALADELKKRAKLECIVSDLTYDLRGAWDFTSTGHHSPLFSNPDDPGDPEIAEKYTVDHVIQGYLAGGVDPAKLVMGLPIYGRAWGGVAGGPPPTQARTDAAAAAAMMMQGMAPPGAQPPPYAWAHGSPGTGLSRAGAELPKGSRGDGLISPRG